MSQSICKQSRGPFNYRLHRPVQQRKRDAISRKAGECRDPWWPILYSTRSEIGKDSSRGWCRYQPPKGRPAQGLLRGKQETPSNRLFINTLSVPPVLERKCFTTAPTTPSSASIKPALPLVRRHTTPSQTLQVSLRENLSLSYTIVAPDCPHEEVYHAIIFTDPSKSHLVTLQNSNQSFISFPSPPHLPIKDFGARRLLGFSCWSLSWALSPNQTDLRSTGIGCRRIPISGLAVWTT